MTVPALRETADAPSVLETHRAGLYVAAAWGDNATTRRHSPLLPKAVLGAIIDEAQARVAEAKAEPLAGFLEATRAAQILVGSYPNVKPHEPLIYAKSLASIFQEYSYATAMRAVDMLTRTSKYLPTRAEILDACGACVEKPDAKYWAALHLAERQLAEHAERERDTAIAAQTPAERARIAAEIKRVCGVTDEQRA